MTMVQVVVSAMVLSFLMWMVSCNIFFVLYPYLILVVGAFDIAGKNCQLALFALVSKEVG
jgi:hypothetical protein